MKSSASRKPAVDGLSHSAAATAEITCGFYSTNSMKSPCPRAASEPDGRCLLHSSNSDKDREAFWFLIEQQLASSDGHFVGYVFPTRASFEQVSFSGWADFSEAHFFEEAAFTGAEFVNSVSFSGAEFREKAYFNRTVFSAKAFFNRVVFSDFASFTQAEFSRGGAEFENAKFLGEASFVGARFSDISASARTRFTDAKFSGEGDFREAMFLGGADFRRTAFSAGAMFTGVTFSGGVGFAETKFGVKADFGRSKWLGGADFAGAEFSGTAEFSNDVQFSDRACFDGTKFLAQALFDRVTFADMVTFRTDLQHVTFRSSNLRYCRFAESTNLEKAEFDNVEWASWPALPRWSWQRTRLAVADEIDARQHPTFSSRSDADDRRALRTAERVYRSLRANYETRKDHPRIGDFYFAEMEMRRLATSSNRFRQAFGSLTAWYGLISGYGERWGWALSWFVGVWILCTALYLNLGLWVKVPTLGANGLSQTSLEYVRLTPAPLAATPVSEVLGAGRDALIHSFLVATLLGRDTYAVPETWIGQVVETIEAVLGPLLLGLIALAIRRQFQR